MKFKLPSLYASRYLIPIAINANIKVISFYLFIYFNTVQIKLTHVPAETLEKSRVKKD